MPENTLSLLWTQLAELPDNEGYAGSFAGTSNGCLIFAAGANFPDKPMWAGGPKHWTDRVFILSDAEKGWKECNPLPQGLGYGASASIPEGLMLIGGSNPQGAVANCYLLQEKDGEVVCSEMPSLPYPLTGHSAAILNGKVYVTGGSLAAGEQDAESRMLVFDLATQTWKQGSPLPARGRFLHQMSSFGESIYILGGIGLLKGEDGRMKRDMLTEAWAYSPCQGWRALSNLPHFCAAAPTPSPVIDEKIYLLGGDDGSISGFSPQEHPGFNSQSLSYSPTENKWKEEGEIAAPRAVLPCVIWEGKAVIINGELRPGKRSNQVWAASAK